MKTIEDEMLPMGFDIRDPVGEPIPVLASEDWWQKWANDTSHDPQPDQEMWDRINRLYPD